MVIDYQVILNQIGDIVEYTLPLAITIGIIERIIRMVIRAATGKTGD